MQDRHLQLWVGMTTSRRRLDRLLAETYDEDRPLSEFASSQDVDFYDHDFLECHRLTKSTNDPRTLLAGVSFAPTFIQSASIAAVQFMPANTAIALHAELLEAPRSASGSGYMLHYVGTFAYDPDFREPLNPPAAPPATISLRIKMGGPLTIQGQQVRTITIRREGLVIGNGAAPHDRPFLDLASTPGGEGIAVTQVSIYPDQFGQWIIEDHGCNGLTRIDSTVLNGERTFPWHRNRLSVGALVFEWYCPRKR